MPKLNYAIIRKKSKGKKQTPLIIKTVKTISK